MLGTRLRIKKNQGYPLIGIEIAVNRHHFLSRLVPHARDIILYSSTGTRDCETWTCC